MDTIKTAEKYGVSRELVEELLTKLRHTGGKQAQFSDEALGGMGQWSAGMVMIGRMGDDALKTKVNALLTELAESIRSETPGEGGVATHEPHAKPSESAMPSATAAGSQNGMRYAYFAADNRLVITRDGAEKIYDATGYPISGVAQDQASGAAGTLRFTTANGEMVDLAALKLVS